jgi:hypothetical protein
VIVRVLNFMVIAALVLAAAYVYRIKFEATVQAERVAKLNDEVRHERDKIAALRARWGELDDPSRIQGLAEKLLKLKPIVPSQFDALDRLPDQPPDYLRPGAKDPIAGMIEHMEEPADLTGSITSAVSGPAAAAQPAAPLAPGAAPP